MKFTATVLKAFKFTAAIKTAGGGIANITNSDNTYNDTVSAGGLKVLADITFTDTDGQVYQVPAQTDIEAAVSLLVSGIDGGDANSVYTDQLIAPGA